MTRQYKINNNKISNVLFNFWDFAGAKTSVIFVNENENGEKRENNEFVNEN